MNVTIREAPLRRAYSSNPHVHYRLYLLPDGTPDVLCVQSFDYDDVALERILDDIEYPSEHHAHQGLAAMLETLLSEPDVAGDLDDADRLAGSGAPLTRRQALLAFQARAIADVSARSVVREIATV